jgi:glycosyltransferase involved in cell wall biosynthesis
LALANELIRSGDRGFRWRFVATADLAARLNPLGVDVTEPSVSGTARRVLWEQVAFARASGGDVLLAAGGFGPLARVRPFVLVAHNALHYGGALPATGLRRTRLALERLHAQASARRAQSVVVPSRAMAAMLRAKTSRPVRVAPFGPGLAAESWGPVAPFTFLHRTHWGPHKALDVLLRAVRQLAERRPGDFRVRTACDPFSSFARKFSVSGGERRLLEDPVVGTHVDIATYELGSREQREVQGDAVVMPSWLESFSFPLAEALWLGLPIVTVDRLYARELCSQAAFYAPAGDPARLSAEMERLLDGERPPHPEPAQVRRLSWKAHVDALADECWAALQVDERSVVSRLYGSRRAGAEDGDLEPL